MQKIDNTDTAQALTTPEDPASTVRAPSEWLPIDTAPKHRVILVNDTFGDHLTTMAEWLECEGLALWAYADEFMCDSYPLGPNPTMWFDVPALPENCKKTFANA